MIRSHRRIHSDLLQSRDILIDSDTSLASTVTKKIKCNGKSSHDLHYSYSSQQRHCGLKRCPHHVALPDNEWSPVDSSSRLQLNNSYQVWWLFSSFFSPLSLFIYVCPHPIRSIAKTNSEKISTQRGSMHNFFSVYFAPLYIDIRCTLYLKYCNIYTYIYIRIIIVLYYVCAFAIKLPRVSRHIHTHTHYSFKLKSAESVCYMSRALFIVLSFSVGCCCLFVVRFYIIPAIVIIIRIYIFGWLAGSNG